MIWSPNVPQTPNNHKLISYDCQVKHKLKNTLFIPMGLITSRASKKHKTIICLEGKTIKKKK